MPSPSATPKNLAYRGHYYKCSLCTMRIESMRGNIGGMQERHSKFCPGKLREISQAALHAQ